MRLVDRLAQRRQRRLRDLFAGSLERAVEDVDRPLRRRFARAVLAACGDRARRREPVTLARS